MPMDMETAISVEAAAPDSHFRLLPCPACQSENVAYVQYSLGRNREPWKVRCFDCNTPLTGRPPASMMPRNIGTRRDEHES